MLQHRKMAHAAISPALRGWERPVGREEAGRKGNNAHTMSREEQSYRAIHREGEDVGQWIWFISPEAKGKVRGGTQLFLICTPMACTKGLPGVSGGFGVVTPTQRSSPHSYVSGRSAKLVSSSHTFQNYKLTASGRSEGPSAHLIVISVKLDTTVVRPLKLFCCFQSLFLCWYCS